MNAAASSSRSVLSAATSSVAPRAKSSAVPGYAHFTTPLRQLIIEAHDSAPSHAGLRAFIRKPLVEMAREHPDVQVTVRRVGNGKAAVMRGLYVNGRDKVICVNALEANEVANKATLLLNSSGAKLRHLRRSILEAGPGAESARGIWSALHQAEGSEYRI